MVEITQAKNDADLQGILALQRKNLAVNLSPEEVADQGFVTVVHHLDILRRMNEAGAHTIAKDGDQVVGYALTMLPSFRTEIPVLMSMFDRLDEMEWNGKSLQDTAYFVMGQVCVAKEYRGQGVFDRLYQGLKDFNSDRFELVVTEISRRNTRSLRAHERFGFDIMEEFTDEENGEEWVIVGASLKS
ncbi:MAG: GNAT family N-acetyltransferase [Saprospiraceae bacterium]|nr:GNAT family N-acetyltransferase [Saprospiraceae bacterium]